jgi:hypothetical protein
MQGKVRLGYTMEGKACLGKKGKARLGKQGKASQGKARRDWARLGVAR